MREISDSFDDIWELAERAVREARVLRSFLEYLRLGHRSAGCEVETDTELATRGRSAAGNPPVKDTAKELFQRLRDSPPELRRELVQAELAKADSLYF
jgi:hypothetical protein